MPERISRFQAGKIDEEKWREGADAASAMKELHQRILQEWKGDVFNIPEEELAAAKETAQSYLDKSKGENAALDTFAQEIVALPDQEQVESVS